MAKASRTYGRRPRNAGRRSAPAEQNQEPDVARRESDAGPTDTDPPVDTTTARPRTPTRTAGRNTDQTSADPAARRPRADRGRTGRGATADTGRRGRSTTRGDDRQPYERARGPMGGGRRRSAEPAGDRAGGRPRRGQEPDGRRRGRSPGQGESRPRGRRIDSGYNSDPTTTHPQTRRSEAGWGRSEEPTDGGRRRGGRAAGDRTARGRHEPPARGGRRGVTPRAGSQGSDTRRSPGGARGRGDGPGRPRSAGPSRAQNAGSGGPRGTRARGTTSHSDQGAASGGMRRGAPPRQGGLETRGGRSHELPPLTDRSDRYQRGPARGRQRPPAGARGETPRTLPSQESRNRGSSQARPTPTGEAEGILELIQRQGGYLRDPQRMLHADPNDVVVPPGLIRQYRLQEGLALEGPCGPGRAGRMELLDVTRVNGQPPSIVDQLRPINDLVPIDPCERLRFATGDEPVTMRAVDLLTPMGKGQRGLIVAPPRTGKTVLLQQMAHGISENHPEVLVKVLLVDERPEEVTDMRRSVRGEVVASSSDMTSGAHVRVAELLLEQARREVELGHDVVIFLDSLTRLGRAYNRETGNSGRTLSGGIDARALERPKRIFGAARNIQDGGSLTIIATALIDTGSRMDEVIFQEFKGTGNMELVLDRDIADHRIWPAIDINLSGTRKEEKLYEPDELTRVHRLRRFISSMEPLPAMNELLQNLADWEGRTASTL